LGHETAWLKRLGADTYRCSVDDTEADYKDLTDRKERIKMANASLQEMKTRDIDGSESDSFAVPAEEQAELKAIVNSTRSDIVLASGSAVA